MSIETKSEKLVTRVTPSQKAMIERAAQIEGRSKTSFVVSHLIQDSQKIIDNHERVLLTRSETVAFVQSLSAPPKRPSASMLKALKAYRTEVIEA